MQTFLQSKSLHYSYIFCLWFDFITDDNLKLFVEQTNVFVDKYTAQGILLEVMLMAVKTNQHTLVIKHKYTKAYYVWLQSLVSSVSQQQFLTDGRTINLDPGAASKEGESTYENMGLHNM